MILQKNALLNGYLFEELKFFLINFFFFCYRICYIFYNKDNNKVAGGNVKRRSFFLHIIFSFLCLNLFSHVNLPENFGKKQFIIGIDPASILKDKKRTNNVEDLLKPTQHGIRCVLFAPDDKVLDVLLYLMAEEKSSIRMAAFLLTDYKIIQAILEAKARGVNIEIVFDSKAVKDFQKKVRLLRGRGIKVFVYKALARHSGKNMSNIMHNKFIVFGDNVFGKSLIWTGSFNFTYSAHKNNQENVVIFDDLDMITKFINRFDYMKTDLCYVFKNKRKRK